MKDPNERALARLSLSAIAVDALVVTLLAAAAQQLIIRYDERAPEWMSIAAIPVALLLHFLVVEFLAGGMSIGRLCNGLKVVDEQTGVTPRMASRAKRCAAVVTKLGLPSLNPNAVPSYNKHPANCICSDWAGPATSVSRPVSGKRTPVAPDVMSAPVRSFDRAAIAARGTPHLTVTGGPHAGQTVALAQGRTFQTNGIFVIGRNQAKADLVLNRDTNVSGVHCRIAAKDGKFVLVDGASSASPSTNGTRQNKKPVSSKGSSILNVGDVIHVGETTLIMTLK